MFLKVQPFFILYDSEDNNNDCNSDDFKSFVYGSMPVTKRKQILSSAVIKTYKLM